MPAPKQNLTSWESYFSVALPIEKYTELGKNIQEFCKPEVNKRQLEIDNDGWIYTMWLFFFLSFFSGSWLDNTPLALVLKLQLDSG